MAHDEIQNYDQPLPEYGDVRDEDMGPQSLQDSLGPLGRFGRGDEGPAVLQDDLEHLSRVVGVLDDQDVNAFKIPMG